MKVRALKYFLIGTITTLCYTSLVAQEGGFMLNSEGRLSPEIPSSPGSEKVYKIKDEDPGKQHEKKAKEQEVAKKQETKPVTPPQEKPEVQSVSKPVIDTTNKEEDPDSVLSFNFLHYIIQRFKFSEVLEQ